jgi:uncharacterized membrane protein
MPESATPTRPRPPPGSGSLVTATLGGVLLGVGLGGFLDGIVLHQILQWHHVLSSVLQPTTMGAMQTNMRWDGFFHAGVWVATLGGVLLLWVGAHRASRPGTAEAEGGLPPLRWLVGLMLIGWGLFNLVEGLVNHHLLGIHHVRGWGPNPAWDFGFLLSGPLLVALGWLVTRSPKTNRNPTT